MTKSHVSIFLLFGVLMIFRFKKSCLTARKSLIGYCLCYTIYSTRRLYKRNSGLTGKIQLEILIFRKIWKILIFLAKGTQFMEYNSCKLMIFRKNRRKMEGGGKVWKKSK